jgi:4-amino-4-deoxy-L-arabinose transferase-like glycosyltransferase
MSGRRALWTVIGLFALVRLTWAASLGSFYNEAYYEMYACHLDWGYFDHPPMVGLVAAVGRGVTPETSPLFGLRLGFLVLFAGSSWLLARLTSRWFGWGAGVIAALVLNGTVYYGLRIGTLADPDGPLLFFWLLTLDRLAAALENPERNRTWVFTGIACGFATLSKYYAALLPAGFFLYLVLRPSARRCLRTPGPYWAGIAAALVFSPVVYWNATHQWASFAFQGRRASGFHGFQPALLLEALVGQILYLTPWIWIGLLVVIIRLVRRGYRAWSDAEAFLFSQAIPALSLFLGVATFRRIMPHWPLIGFVALMPLLGRILVERYEARPSRVRSVLAAFAAVPIVLGCLFVAQARYGVLQDRRGLVLGWIPPRLDPTVDIIRWPQVARELKRRGLLDEPDTFLFTDSWRCSADLAVATSHRIPVACYQRDARSFRFWSRPEDWVGHDGILIGDNDSSAQPKDYAPWFSRIERLAPITVVRRGVSLQTVQLYRCVHQTAPFQFGYPGPGGIPLPALDVAPNGPTAGHQLRFRAIR